METERARLEKAPAPRRDLAARLRTLVAAALAALAVPALAAACDGGRPTSGPGEFPVRFVVANALIAPVTISIDGAPQATLTHGASIGLTVSSSAQWLTWTSAKPMDAMGRPIPDDIGEVKIAISGINGALEIRNVIDDRTYITARVFNPTTAPVSVGVYDGSSVSCAAELPAASRGEVGFVQIGYYRLLPATEVRAYRDPSRCTGPYVSWPAARLAGFAAKSGLLALVLESPP